MSAVRNKENPRKDSQKEWKMQEKALRERNVHMVPKASNSHDSRLVVLLRVARTEFYIVVVADVLLVYVFCLECFAVKEDILKAPSSVWFVRLAGA